MFSQACASHSVHRGKGSLYDVTSCLAAWCHVPFRRSLSLVPCSFWGSLSLVPCSCQGGGVWYGKEWVVRILLECILVWYGHQFFLRPDSRFGFKIHGSVRNIMHKCTCQEGIFYEILFMTFLCFPFSLQLLTV